MENHFIEADGVQYGVPEVTSLLSFVPTEILDLSLDYKVAWIGERGNFTLKDTGSLITFNFQENHTEEILLHEQCGGGRESLDALRKLRLLPHISASIRQAI